MKTKLYVRKLTEIEQNELKSKDFTFCKCCDFDKVTLLRYNERHKQFHGVGYGCENECKNKDCTLCSIMDNLHHQSNVIIFNNIEDFLEYESSKN